ncbi:MAG: hypothetical protein QNJ40_02180 [Xanthomonadales bacterium]|nr:hypothetical protein [Xanthomonadales bacterium]
MEEKYVPPEYPPFPNDKESVMAALAPYFLEQQPMDFFFEMFICDVLEELPKETQEALSSFADETT